MSGAGVRTLPNKEKRRNRKFKVIVYASEGAKGFITANDTRNALTKAVNPFKLNIKPDKIIKTKNNDILIESSTNDVERLIGNKDLENNKLVYRAPKKLWPKVRIYNVAKSFKQSRRS